MSNQKVESKSLFVVVVTDNPGFIQNKERYLKMCKEVEDQHFKPMYLLVKKNVNWDDFSHFPWRPCTPLFFETDEEFDKAFEIIKKDVQWIKVINM